MIVVVHVVPLLQHWLRVFGASIGTALLLAIQSRKKLMCWQHAQQRRRRPTHVMVGEIKLRNVSDSVGKNGALPPPRASLPPSRPPER